MSDSIRPFLLPLLLSTFLAGCATTSPLKVPVRPAPPHAAAQPPLARLRIPVVVSLPQLADVEKKIRTFFKSDWDKEAAQSLTKSLGTTVWWNPLEWKMEDNHLSAKMQVYARSDDQGEKKVPVEVNADLQWGKNWRLEAPDLAEGDTINARGEGEDDAEKVERLLRKGTAQYHQNLAKGTAGIEAKAKEMWKEIQEPIRMAEDIWLQITPTSVSVGNYRLVADLPFPRLESVFEIVAQPKVIFGKKPHPLKTELPPISDYQNGPEGFHVATNLKVSFKEVNKLLVDPKTGILKKILPQSGGHQLKISNLNLYGSGGKLVVEATVDYYPLLNLSSNPSQLTLYLVGTPTFHKKTQVIDFPDMDFDIQTSDFLVQAADFIAGSGMREQLRQQAAIPVGPKLDKLKAEVTALLNRPLGGFARLKTTVDSLRMEEAFVSDYGIEGRVSMDGNAMVEANW